MFIRYQQKTFAVIEFITISITLIIITTIQEMLLYLPEIIIIG